MLPVLSVTTDEYGERVAVAFLRLCLYRPVVADEGIASVTECDGIKAAVVVRDVGEREFAPRKTVVGRQGCTYIPATSTTECLESSVRKGDDGWLYGED